MNRIQHIIAGVIFSVAIVFALCPFACADSSAGNVATSGDYGGREAVNAEGMSKVTGDQIADGTYSIIVETDTQMFNIVDCQLTVKNGKMTAVVTLSSDGYQWLYNGTAQQAAAAAEGDRIPYVKDAEGDYTYDIGEVTALNADIQCSSYSKRRGQWYDHTIVFIAGSLPESALSTEAQQAVRASTPIKDLKNGKYTIAADISGGNDELVSPAPLTVENGKATVKLEFNGTDYQKILMAGETYTADMSSGASVFELPAVVFDTAVPVTITTAKKDILTTISLHSGQIEIADGQGVPLAGIVVVCIVAIIVIAGVVFIRRRKMKDLEE